MPITISDVADLVRLLETHPEWQEALQRRLITKQLLLRMLAEDDDLRAEVRRLVLGDDLTQLSAHAQRTEEQLTELTATVRFLAEAQRRTEQQVAELAEAQRRTEQQIAQLVHVVQDLVQRLARLEQWRDGEAGRREGERYEREIRRQAMSLFYGGFGGAPEEPQVMERVREWIAKLTTPERLLTREHDPMLADLLWWKGGRVFVVEVSLKVDRTDILRAKGRAELLRRIGVDATPVVIGEEWATPEARDTAITQGVAWFAGGEMSPEFVEIRKLADGIA